MHDMNAVEHIRTKVFKLKQGPFAAVAGVSQATVSRWEKQGKEPSREKLDNIRKAAIEAGLEWNDSLFFEKPPVDQVSA